MSEEIIYRRSGARVDVCFNRPQQHNAMTFSMYESLEKFCDQIDQDDSVRVLVFRGAGEKAFVAGTDISQFQAFNGGSDAIAYENRIDRVVGRVANLKCTTIAVLQGVCAGGGVPIALACDFRYSDQSLRLGVPIARTLGNCLSMNNVALLIDHVGVARAKEMLMLGKMINAQEAEAIGVVNGVFESNDLDLKTGQLVESILALAPLTQQAVKASIQRTQEMRRASSESGEDLIRMCYESEDFHGAVAAFLQKRKPVWRGR